MFLVSFWSEKNIYIHLVCCLMFESLIIFLRCQKVGQVRVQMTRGKKETPCGYGRWMMNRSRVAVTALVYTVWLWSWGIPFCMFECVREPDAECKELSVSFLYSRRIEKCSYVSIHGIAPFQNRMSQIKLPPINVLYLEWLLTCITLLFWRPN